MIAVYYDEAVNMANIKNINFDTLKYANRLKAVGVPDKHAEMQAELQSETIAQQTDVINELHNVIENSLATKQDINELKQDINELRQATKQDISELKQDINELRQATKQDISELKQDINELRQATKQDMVGVMQYTEKRIEECIALSEERTNKNISHMGYKIMVVLVGVLGGMIAALGFLIKAN